MNQIGSHSPATARTTGFSETPRQLVHIAMSAFALLLRYLTWWEAGLLAIAALAFNLLVLPRIGGRALYRPVDTVRGFPLGIALYPVSVLLLILVFPRRPDIVAAAWGIMAFGDGLATVVGSRARGGRLPWNADKSVAGVVAFVLGGSAAGFALASWTAPAVHPAPSWVFLVAGPVAAAVIASFVETIPVRLDDNVSVPATAGAVLWMASLVTAAAWHQAAGTVSANLLLAFVVNGVMATAGWRARTVSAAGAVAGAIIGVIVFAATGFPGWLLLFASFLAASIASRMGLKRKALLGIAEEREGRRGPGNAIANCLVATAAAFIVVSTPHADSALLALVAALAAGGSDTVASEIGKAWGRRTFLVPTFKHVRPGTSGGVSIEGTAAGVLAAFALVAMGSALRLIGRDMIWVAVVGATVGSLAESWLGATLEGLGFLNNDLLNFLNTAIAATTALLLAGIR